MNLRIRKKNTFISRIFKTIINKNSKFQRKFFKAKIRKHVYAKNKNPRQNFDKKKLTNGSITNSAIVKTAGFGRQNLPLSAPPNKILPISTVPIRVANSGTTDFLIIDQAKT